MESPPAASADRFDLLLGRRAFGLSGSLAIGGSSPATSVRSTKTGDETSDTTADAVAPVIGAGPFVDATEFVLERSGVDEAVVPAAVPLPLPLTLRARGDGVVAEGGVAVGFEAAAEAEVAVDG